MNKIAEKIEEHFKNKTYCKITRKVGKDAVEMSSGYIVDYSDNFLLLHETGDFLVVCYNVLPINQIQKIRFNKWDKCQNKIMILEGEIEKVGIKYKIDLNSWETVFKSIKNHLLNVIVECESPDIAGFTIGPIVKTTKKYVYIQNFDPAGVLDEKPTSIDFESVTKVKFDDRYINIFSKYLRPKRSGKVYNYSIKKGEKLSAIRIK